jgi:1-deoxy-D-xylulose 5-phosphate reductoisomerase
MARIMILGATGSLGKQVTAQAVAANHDVSVLVRTPAMIVPYVDAAALMLHHLQPESIMSRRRVGLALPIGMRGMKAGWSARPATVDDC